MAKMEISTKRLAIGKANAQMVGVVAAASFITVFCLVAANAAWGETRYQTRVISAENTANKQLTTNLQTFKSLQSSYASFDGKSTNILGGSSTGTKQNDGTNSTIILHALPDSYDFPELASSIENILNTSHLQIGGISGTDDQVNQQSNTSSTTPQAVQMPFSFSVTNASYTSLSQLVTQLQQSIRPIQVDQMTLSGSSGSMTLSINAHSDYQPAKEVNITKKVVK